MIPTLRQPGPTETADASQQMRMSRGVMERGRDLLARVEAICRGRIDTLSAAAEPPAADLTEAAYRADVEAIGGILAVPKILEVVRRITGMRFVAVARVSDDRWIACSVHDDIGIGLRPGGELNIETTICREIQQLRTPVIINDVSRDAVYRSHPTPAMYGFQSYVSMPIVMPDGSFFGTLCAVDPLPRVLDTPEIVESFRLFAELIALNLDAARRSADTEATLSRERQISELRELFIGVLGHDLRNPLASVSAGTGLLLEHPERAAEITGHIEDSVSRMAELIDNVLDFANSRVGGGLTVHRDADEPIEPTLVAGGAGAAQHPSGPRDQRRTGADAAGQL